MRNFFTVLVPVIIAVQETWFLPTDPYALTFSIIHLIVTISYLENADMEVSRSISTTTSLTAR